MPLGCWPAALSSGHASGTQRRLLACCSAFVKRNRHTALAILHNLGHNLRQCRRVPRSQNPVPQRPSFGLTLSQVTHGLPTRLTPIYQNPAMHNPALLVVDVQRGFINEHTAHIPALIESLLPSYQNVFATRFYNPENSNYRRLIKWNRFSPKSADFEFAFTPTSNVRIINKPIYTCVNSEFLSTLEGLMISEIHIAGIDTDICVTKCAVDIFEKGLTPFVLAKYCASHAGPALHQAALKILARFIGSEQVIV